MKVGGFIFGDGEQEFDFDCEDENDYSEDIDEESITCTVQVIILFF